MPIKSIMQLRPRAYDPQKATRITLFNGLLTYVLGCIWIGNVGGDAEFADFIERFGDALGRSRYLDGHQTNWASSFGRWCGSAAVTRS